MCDAASLLHGHLSALHAENGHLYCLLDGSLFVHREVHGAHSFQYCCICILAVEAEAIGDDNERLA